MTSKVMFKSAAAPNALGKMAGRPASGASLVLTGLFAMRAPLV
ncbi:MAG: hypothetical protein OEZ04_06700 [Nitrospinota bacterium]|nr:hypothetical protein [Nitrospinota bacterium]